VNNATTKKQPRKFAKTKKQSPTQTPRRSCALKHIHQQQLKQKTKPTQWQLSKNKQPKPNTAKPELECHNSFMLKRANFFGEVFWSK